MREHRRAALCAKDTDIEQRQARPLHQAGLRLQRREGSLHLPGQHLTRGRVRSDRRQLVRRQTVEHPYGTIKAWMGSTHFLTRTLKRVSTEMSLHVLAYNIKRVIAIIGVGPLLQAIRA